MLRPLVIGVGAFALLFLVLVLGFRPSIDMISPRPPLEWWGALGTGAFLAGWVWHPKARPTFLRTGITALLLCLLAGAILIGFLYSALLVMQVIVIGFATLGDILTGGIYALAQSLQDDLRIRYPLRFTEVLIAAMACWALLQAGRGLRGLWR